MKRREFVKSVATTAAAAGGVGALAGCAAYEQTTGGGTGGNGFGASMVVGGPQSFSIDPRQYADRFERVVFATEYDGIDPNSGEEQVIDDVLRDAVEPGTLLVFPAGRYVMNRPFSYTGRSGAVGIIGTGGAVIRHGRVDEIHDSRVTDGEYRGRSILFHLGAANNPHDGTLIFGGFHFDFRAENAGLQILNSWCRGRHIVENIRQVGEHSLGSHGAFRLGTLSADSYGTYRNLDISAGGRHYENTINTKSTPSRTGRGYGASWSTSGITIGRRQAGTMVFVGIATGSWPDNGLYIKGGVDGGTVGRKILSDFFAANSHVSNVRTNSGDDWEPIPEFDGTDGTPAAGYENSVIENGIVLVDRQEDVSAYWNQIGIRADGGPVTIRNVTVTLQRPTGTGIHIQADSGGTTLSNVLVELYERERAISATTQNVAAENVRVNGIGFDPPDGLVSGGVSDLAGVSIGSVERGQSFSGTDQLPSIGSPPAAAGDRSAHIPFDSPGDVNQLSRATGATSIVSPPAVSGSALRVDIPRGEHSGCDLRVDLRDAWGAYPEAAHARYYLFFDETWNFGDGHANGGKLPGFAHKMGSAGSGGNPVDGSNGWSARGAHRPPRSGGDLRLGTYLYHADMSGRYGDTAIWNENAELQFGRWYQIDQYARVNTPGQNDGILRAWVDERPAFEKTDVKMRETGHSDIKIGQFWINFYVGGSWTSTRDAFAAVDELTLSA